MVQPPNRPDQPDSSANERTTPSTPRKDASIVVDESHTPTPEINIDASDPSIATVVFQAQSSRFSGPLPPPDILGGYEDILPGSADRILSMAESSLATQNEIKLIEARGNVTTRERGQIFAFVLGLVALLGGFALVAMGHDAAGIAGIITGVTALTAAAVWSRLKGDASKAE